MTTARMARIRIGVSAATIASISLLGTSVLAGEPSSIELVKVFEGEVAGVETLSGAELDSLRGGAFLSSNFFSNIINATGGQNSVTVAQDGQFEEQSGSDSISITLTSSTQTSTGTVTTSSSTASTSQSQ